MQTKRKIVNMKPGCGSHEQLSAYMDGELDMPARERIESHLRECAACDEYLRHLKVLRQDVSALGNETVGFDLVSRLRHRLETARASKPWQIRPWRWLPLSFAATASAVVVGAFLGSALMHVSDGIAGNSTSAMSLFDPIPPGGITPGVSSRQGKS